MDNLLQDIRYALRSLFKNRTITLLAVLTLGLGIGANTVVFSVFHAVLLRALPYKSPDRLVLLWTNFGADLPQNWISGPEFVEMREFANVFEEIGVVVPFNAGITGNGDPEEVGAAGASANFFEVLEVSAHRGRLFQDGDDAPGAPATVILSHAYWKRRFAEDPEIVGKKINLSGFPFQVIGVLPENFSILHPDAQFPRQIEVWTPLTTIFGAIFGVDEYSRMPRGSHAMRGFGRLKPGVSMAQAQQDMDTVAAKIQEKSPNYYDFEGWGITAVSLHDDLVEEIRPALLVLLGAVGFVLLIACVNVANLLLTRSLGREREIAVRSALGASRLRLVRQLLTESLVLAFLGGAAGVVLALTLLRFFNLLAPGSIPRIGEVSVSMDVLLFTVGCCLATGILFGLAPASHALKEDLVNSLKEGARGASHGLKGQRLRGLLVAAEVALAVILLVGAGLMIRSFSRLLDTDPGYRSEQLLTLRVNLSPARYSEDSTRTAFFDQLLQRVRALPGVRSAGAISQLPLSGQAMSGTTAVRQSQTLPHDQLAGEIDRRIVTPGYFESMGVRLIAGRFFDDRDHAQAPPVAIVDEEFARRFWPQEEPLGQHISINFGPDRRWREVVGVVAHSRHNNVRTIGRGQAYFPLPQQPFSSMYLAIRSQGDPEPLAESVRQEVLRLDPDQPVSDVAAMQQRFDDSVSQTRFTFLLLAGFAGLALLLAAVGIYGVMSYTVTQRRSEIGIRMALGANSGRVSGLILRQGLWLLAVGVVIGVPLAFGLSRFMRSVLYEVAPTDLTTYAAVLMVLILTGLVSCLFPALRASRTDPARVLQSE